MILSYDIINSQITNISLGLKMVEVCCILSMGRIALSTLKHGCCMLQQCLLSFHRVVDLLEILLWNIGTSCILE